MPTTQKLWPHLAVGAAQTIGWPPDRPTYRLATYATACGHLEPAELATQDITQVVCGDCLTAATDTASGRSLNRILTATRLAYEIRGVPDQPAAETWPYLLEEVGELHAAVRGPAGGALAEAADVTIVLTHIAEVTGVGVGSPPSWRPLMTSDTMRLLTLSVGCVAGCLRRDRLPAAKAAVVTALEQLAAVTWSRRVELPTVVEQKVRADQDRLAGY